MLPIADGFLKKGGKRYLEQIRVVGVKIPTALNMFLDNGRIKAMGEHAVGPMEGGMEDGVSVLPLVPRNIPEPLDERSNPALRRVVSMG